MSDIPELPAEPAPATATPARQGAPRPRARVLALMLSVPLLAMLGAGAYWFTGGATESTENAALHQARIPVASAIGGRVVRVGVHDMQPVKAGDLLFQVDPEPYRLALASAETAVAQARMRVEQLKADYRQALAAEAQARENADYLQKDLDRQAALSRRGVVTDTTLDSARHLAAQAADQARLAALAVEAATAALGGSVDQPTDDHPTVRAALVALDQARYNLSVTTVTAPTDGVVYQAASFKEGAMVAAGQSVFALVESGDVWIEANFKETQLADIAVGQPAEIDFDMAPGHSFSGTVEAIGAGTGAEFSLLPAQNATGNWVKVTQRVPVRIRLDDPAQVAGLASGISASVTVQTGDAAPPLSAQAGN